MRLIEELFNIVAPHECVGCGGEGSLLCSVCATNLEQIPPRCYVCKRWSDDFRTCKTCQKRTPLNAAYTVVAYEGSAKLLLHRLKFERARTAASIIAGQLAARCGQSDEGIVTYIPTANVRVRSRGYDQAALIAKELARLLDRPFLPLLARTGSQRQVGQRRDVRAEQMRQAFRIVGKLPLEHKNVLLVDDVLTTGATCEAAARVLKQAGIKNVHAAVFAVA